ncbi:unnamed protein product [Gongylonema pulchrum]|uniref:PP1-binding domain-containing protein n=1 Tax=Gongylonema pulchrum TaxID=637853 RepID=A0A183EDM2_9BILA|nr:unnamed protein product [Gongylonema pulchrum]
MTEIMVISSKAKKKNPIKTQFKRIVPPKVKLIPMSPVESPAASHSENCATERSEQVQCPSRKGVRKKSNSSLKQNRSGKKHLCTSSNQAKSSSSKGTRSERAKSTAKGAPSSKSSASISGKSSSGDRPTETCGKIYEKSLACDRKITGREPAVSGNRRSPTQVCQTDERGGLLKKRLLFRCRTTGDKNDDNDDANEDGRKAGGENDDEAAAATTVPLVGRDEAAATAVNCPDFSSQNHHHPSLGKTAREEATVPDTIDACGREQSEKSILTDPVAPMGSQNSTANSKHTTDKLPVENEQLANTESAAKDTADQMATHGDAKVALDLVSGLAAGQQKAGKSAGGQVKGQKSSSSSEEEEDEEEASTESRHLPVQLVRRSSEEGFHQVVKFTKHAAQRLKATAAKPKQIISPKNEKKSEQATKEQNLPVTEEEAKNQGRKKCDGLDEKSNCIKIMPELHSLTENSFDKTPTPVDTAPFDTRGITGNQTFLDRFPVGQNEADTSLKEPCNKQKRQQPNPEEVTCSDSKTLV